MMTDNQVLTLVVAMQWPFVWMLGRDAYALIRERRRRRRAEERTIVP